MIKKPIFIHYNKKYFFNKNSYLLNMQNFVFPISNKYGHKFNYIIPN